MANWITVSRFPVLIAYVLILYLAPAGWRLAAVLLLFAGLMLDTVDGVVARRRKETSLLGSVLDIAADRSYELVLWVCFADLRLIPVAIPLIVITRTTLTDAIRSIGIGKGQAPFTQQQSRLGRFLVASSWMRSGYSISKILAFLALAVTQAALEFPAGTALQRAAEPIGRAAGVIAWIAAAICVLRGLPVITGAIRRHWGGPDGEPLTGKA